LQPVAPAAHPPKSGRGKQRETDPSQTQASGTSPDAPTLSTTDAAVVKVRARTFTVSAEALTNSLQHRLKEIQLAMGASVFIVLEAAMTKLQAEGGAVYVPVADEMVAIATILPNSLTNPPPLVKHLIAGSVTGSVLTSGVTLHQTGPGLDDNNRRVPSQLLVPVISRSGARVGVLQLTGKYRGAAKFTQSDEVYALHVAQLLAAMLTRYPVQWAGPAFDPVALHKTSPYAPAVLARSIHETLPEEIRTFEPAPLVHRTGTTVSLAKRGALAEDAAALTSAPTLRELDCYVDNLQACWRRSVQLNIAHGQQEEERLNQLRSMREQLRKAQSDAQRMSDKLRLEHLDVSDYRTEYSTLREELDRYLSKKHAFDD
jgi:hypothetical protein